MALSHGGTATYNAALTAVVASDGPDSVGQIMFDYTGRWIAAGIRTRKRCGLRK